MLKKVFLLFALAVIFSGCAESSIFPNVPLTLNPLVLANPISMVASANSKRLYIVNSNNRVNYFDASFVIMDITNPVSPVAIAVISIPNYGGQIILDELRGLVYIPDRQSSSENDFEDQVLVININEASPGFLTTDLIPSTANPFGAFFEGNLLYVATTAQAVLYNVDNFSGFTAVDLPVITNLGEEIEADRTREIAVSPSGNNVFVTNEDGSMLILNAAEFLPPTAPGQADLGTEPIDYVVFDAVSTRGITRDANFLYVVEVIPSALRIMTDAGLAPVQGAPLQITSSSLQVGSIPVGNDPGEVVLDEANMLAFVSNTGDDTVSVIDLALQQEIGRINISTTPETLFETGDTQEGDQPFGMAYVNIDGTNYLYVAHFETSIVSVINADTLTVLNTFP